MATSLSPFLDQFPLPLAHPFTRVQARAVGVSDARLSRLCKQGLLRRPIKGVYVATHVTDTLDLRVEILQLVVPEDVVITDRTAGWLHGAPMILAPNDHLRVPPISLFGSPKKGRLRNSITSSGERMLRPDDIVEIGGLRVTTALRTAWDLGRLLHRKQALGALDSLLRLGVFTHDELLAGIDRFKGYRGVIQLRILAPAADGRAESPGESALRVEWLDAGLPIPELQIPILVSGREVARLDLGLEELRFAAEYDGQEWHSSEEDQEHDETRRTWLSDQRGWVIAGYDRSNVYGRSANAALLLRQAYEEARRSFPVRSYIF